MSRCVQRQSWRRMGGSVLGLCDGCPSRGFGSLWHPLNADKPQPIAASPASPGSLGGFKRQRALLM